MNCGWTWSKPLLWCGPFSLKRLPPPSLVIKRLWEASGTTSYTRQDSTYPGGYHNVYSPTHLPHKWSFSEVTSEHWCVYLWHNQPRNPYFCTYYLNSSLLLLSVGSLTLWKENDVPHIPLLSDVQHLKHTGSNQADFWHKVCINQHQCIDYWEVILIEFSDTEYFVEEDRKLW